MKLEDRLRRELHDTAEHLIITRDKLEDVVRKGQRRRRAIVLSGALGAVAVGALVLVAITLRPFFPAPIANEPSTTTAPTETMTVASNTTIASLPGVPTRPALVIVGPQGLTVHSLEPTVTALQSDIYFETIASAISDGAGGLIYQHEVTPLPWDQGTILRLAAGTSKPEPLVAPEQGAYLHPLDVVEETLIYRQDSGGSSWILGMDLSTRAIRTIVPETAFLIGASTAGGTVVVLVGGDCSSFAYYTTGGTKVPPPQWDSGGCLSGSVFQVAFTGQYIYTLEDNAEGRWLVRRDFASGEEQAISVGAETWRLDATADGTVAIGSREIYVGRFDGNLTEQTVVPPSFHDFALAELGDFGPGATLGSGQNQLPCTPLDLKSPSSQGLPELVELRRHKLFTLAATCEMEALAKIAVTDGTAFTFGGESDPLRSWIRAARNGFDVMSWMPRILESTPAVDPLGTYAWPAVHATNTEADWQALAGIMTAAEFEQYYSIRDSGYLGLRVGIDPDGRWAYVIAGD